MHAEFLERGQVAQVLRAAQRDLEGIRIPARCGGRVACHLDEFDGVAARREEAVAESAGAPRRRGRVAADMNGDRAVHRLRPAIGAVETDELAGERRALLGPQRAQHGDVLIGACRTVREGGTDRVELLLQPADAYTEEDAPAGHRIERRDLLGGDHGAVLRKDENPGAKLDGSRLRRRHRPSR